MSDTPPARTPLQRIDDVIDALDVAEPEHARASAEFLREQLRGTGDEPPGALFVGEDDEVVGWAAPAPAVK